MLHIELLELRLAWPAANSLLSEKPERWAFDHTRDHVLTVSTGTMSTEDDRFSPPPNWCDPRIESGFMTGCFPLCEGKDAPPVGTDDLKERRKLEFVAAYYRINCAYERLAAASETDRRTAVLELNDELSARDELEDRYTPIGFLAEPRLHGVQTVDLTFMHAPDTPPPTSILLSSAFSILPPLSIPEEAPSQVLDLAGFQQFLEGQMNPSAPTDAEAHT